jgi:DNA-binding SARP family transcriptional activator/ATP/maltotriose-dependent transcriptional regulator MalT
MKTKKWYCEQHSYFPELTEKWIQRVDRNRQRKNLFVVGHAGQGKTVSILHYLNRHAIPHIHLQLSPDDRDSVSLLSKITALLNRNEARYGASLWLDRQDRSPDHAGATEYDVQSHLAKQPKGFTLFFDDTHVLPENSKSIHLISQLIRQSAPGIHFIFAGRDIRYTGDLYRTHSETSCLIQASRPHIPFDGFRQWADSWQLALSIEQIGQLYYFCDDWIAGGLFIAQHLRNLDIVGRERYFAELKNGNLPPIMTSFFECEVISAFSNQVQKNLIELAVPDIIDLNPSRPVGFLQKRKSVIERVNAHHLFVRETTSPLTGPGLRLNRLFRHFLLAKSKDCFTDEERRKKCLQCGASFVDARLDLLAVGCYVQAGDTTAAKTILIREAENTLRFYDCLNLDHWMSCFDQHDIMSDPWMSLFHCAGHRFDDMKDKVALLKNAIAVFNSQKTMSGSMLATALLIENLVLSGDTFGIMPSLSAHATALLKNADIDRIPYAYAFLRIQLGGYFIFFLGEISHARDHLWKAYILGRQIKDHDVQVYALLYLCIGSSLAMDLASGAEFKTLLAGQIDQAGSEIVTLLSQLAMAALEIPRAKNARVAGVLQNVKKQIELTSLGLLRPFVLFAESKFYFFNRRFGQAAAIMRHLAQTGHSTGHPFFKNTCYRVLAQIAYFENNLVEAENLLANCNQPDMNEPIGLYQALILQFQSLFDLHNGKLDRAGEILQRLQCEFERHQSHVSTMENYLLRGMLAHARGDRDACIQWLKAGLTIGAREEIDTFFILSARDIVQISKLTFEYGEDSHAAYAEGLLSGPFSHAASEYFEGLCPKGNANLQERMLQIQKRALLKNRPVITVQTLGDFTVSRNNRPIDALQWSGLSPQQLLKAIICRGGKNVILDRIVEDLWPAHDPQKAMQTFRVTLHRLRKTLEPDIRKLIGSSYILFKDGLISLNDALVSIDAVQYSLLAVKARESAKSGRTTQALELCRKADGLYNGDFLPGELFCQWTCAERRRLQKLRMQQLMVMSDILEERGFLLETVDVLDKLVEMDPYNELLYRKLILTYVRIGMRAKAVATFNTCREILKADLNTEPDPQTQSAYETCLNSMAPKRP